MHRRRNNNVRDRFGRPRKSCTLAVRRSKQPHAKRAISFGVEKRHRPVGIQYRYTHV